MQHALEILPDDPDPGQPLRDLGSRLARARHDAEMSQQVAADRLLVSVDTLSRWERGKNEPGALQISRLAETYGVSTDWILGMAKLTNGLSPGLSVVDRDAVEQIRDAAESGESLRAIQKLIHPPGITCAWDIPAQPDLVPTEEAEALNREVSRWIEQIKQNSPGGR